MNRLARPHRYLARQPACSVWICLGLALVALAAAVPAIAQPLPIGLPTEAEQGNLRKYQIKRVGTLEVAPVYFEGIRLFDVSAPASRDPKAFPAVAARVDVIEDNLREVVPPATTFGDFFKPPPTRYNPDTFEVRVAERNGYVTLVSADRNGTSETSLLTLTDQDAKYNGVSVHVLAEQWAETLQSVLGEALRARQPEALGHQIGSALRVLLIAILSTVLFVFLRMLVQRQSDAIEKRLELGDEAVEAPGEETEGKRSALRIVRNALVVADWLLAWCIVITWALAILMILYAFPPSQALARKLLSEATALAAIWIIAGIANRVGSFVVARAAQSWEERPFLNLDEAGRRQLRLPTITRALEYTKSMIVYVAAAALSLGSLGASASAVVTLGAAVAFAISFGAQSLVKDLVNGFFILVEDQYAIGDYVTIGTAVGVVEAVTLRITQLRSDDGRLVTVPNSQVAVVDNWTRGWSRVDYRYVIAYDSDVAHALEVFENVLKQLARDPQWSRLISETPRVLGVESVSSTGIVLRGWVQTVPGKMFIVSREINRRMSEAMIGEGILPGTVVSRMLVNEPTKAEQPAQPAESAQPATASTDTHA